MRRLFGFLMLVILCGCSLYRSSGRKFLESDLNTIGVSVQAYVQGCDRQTAAVAGGAWSQAGSDDQADLFISGENALLLRVVPRADQSFHCDYLFPSSDDALKSSDDAVVYTLQQLAAAP